MGPRMRLFLVSALCGAGAFGLGLIAGKSECKRAGISVIAAPGTHYIDGALDFAEVYMCSQYLSKDGKRDQQFDALKHWYRRYTECERSAQRYHIDNAATDKP